MLSLRNPARTKWSDGTTEDKTIQFTIRPRIEVAPSDDDYTAITEALAQAPEGAIVHLTAATYYPTNTIAIARDVTLAGTGSNTILDFQNMCSGFSLTYSKAKICSLKIYRGSVNGDGGGVNMTQGVVSNCLIEACVANGTNGDAGGVYITGGLLVDSEITGCKFNNIYGHGNAIYMTGGTVRGCNIHGNDGGYWHTNPDYGDSIVYLAGGVLESSRIHHNVKASNAGVRIKGAGTVRNCLIYGNSGGGGSGNAYGSAGISMNAGTVAYCTVYGNVMKGDTTGRSGIQRSGGTVKNCIFWANGPEGGSAGSCEVSGSADTFVKNVLDKALPEYSDNRAADPKFTDAENEDFTISARSSSAYGYAVPMENVTTDITGFTRDATAPTCGAYEYDLSGETFDVDISFTQSDYRAGSPVTVQAVVMGVDISEVDIRWYLDGAEQVGETGEYLTMQGLSLGYHSLSVTAVKKSGGDLVSKNCRDCLAIRPVECFVNTTGAGAYPFDTAEKGTNSLQAVLAALWTAADVTSVVHVAEGTYEATSGITLMDKIRLIGEDRDRVTFVHNGLRVFTVANAAAEISGITVRGSGANSAEGAFTCQSGRIVNCSARSIVNMNVNASGAGFRVSGGEVVDCEAIDCVSGGTYGCGGGLDISGGTVSNLLLRGCRSYDSFDHGGGGAINATGGTLKKVTVSGTRMEYVNGCAILAKGGMFDSCSVVGCTSTTSRVVHFEGNPTVRNCLFAGNVGGGDTRSTIDLASGTYENCTFAMNSNAYVCLSATNLVARNTIFAECGGTNRLFGTYSNCCAPSLENGVDGNISADPKFRDHEAGNFRLKSSSPCVNAGQILPWMSDSSVDLDGCRRVTDRLPDIGCYETLPAGLSVFLR